MTSSRSPRKCRNTISFAARCRSRTGVCSLRSRCRAVASSASTSRATRGRSGGAREERRRDGRLQARHLPAAPRAAEVDERGKNGDETCEARDDQTREKNHQKDSEEEG